MRRQRDIPWFKVSLSMMVLLFMPVVVHADNNAKAVHPELSEQEMYISCADCHKEATPELEKQWYDSSHGIAIVKCYQCHGTFGTFKLTPTRTDCAVCHMDQLTKCSTDTACWDCHTPHLFKAKK